MEFGRHSRHGTQGTVPGVPAVSGTHANRPRVPSFRKAGQAELNTAFRQEETGCETKRKRNTGQAGDL